MKASDRFASGGLVRLEGSCIIHVTALDHHQKVAGI